MKGFINLYLLIMIIIALGAIIELFFIERKKVIRSGLWDGFRLVSWEDNPEEYRRIIRQGRIAALAIILVCIFFLILISVYY
ncbi:MAG: hypothetical protein JSW60_02585 [Thermoplasmatales archaeon]|nr:MAG: hypothetical protein JSW60_02585 [Thermoplasmatales archaeon]